jgi:hypothetical protein
LTGDLHACTVKLSRNGFGPDALFERGGNYRYGNLAQSGDDVSAAATNAGRLTTGKIALARGWLQSETIGFMFHLIVCPSGFVAARHVPKRSAVDAGARESGTFGRLVQ